MSISTHWPSHTLFLSFFFAFYLSCFPSYFVFSLSLFLSVCASSRSLCLTQSFFISLFPPSLSCSPPSTSSHAVHELGYLSVTWPETGYLWLIGTKTSLKVYLLHLRASQSPASVPCTHCQAHNSTVVSLPTCSRGLFSFLPHLSNSVRAF